MDRFTKGLFALLAVVLLGAAMLLRGGAPTVLAGPLPALTASAEPPTATPTNTPSPTSTTGTGPTETPLPTLTPPTEPTVPTAPPEEPPGRERVADPAVSKEADRSEVALGEEITFRITVTNEGNALAQGVIVEDPLPGFLALVSASVDKGQAVTNGNTAGFWIGDVEPGEVIRGTVTARVVAIPEGGEGVNEVVLRSVNQSDRLINNRSAVRLRVTGPTPTPTADPAGLPSPTPTPAPVAAQPTPPPPSSLPVTAGSTELPLGLLLLIFLVGVGYMAAGASFWRRPRP
ncbi:MAG TPA: DUF11 domain-containing protein [Chloroflexaceae bacterium]|nr:DUF11 domain-containing protein [Chloroflexaceae bacterium]